MTKMETIAKSGKVNKVKLKKLQKNLDASSVGKEIWNLGNLSQNQKTIMVGKP